MANVTTTLNSTACYRHSCPATGAKAPVSAAPAKGLNGREENVGVYLFDAAAIADALEGKTLMAAQLVLTRNTRYGTELKQVSIAPTDGIQAGVSVSRERMRDYAMRGLAYTVEVSGETTAVQLPGAVLQKLAAGEVAGFMLYTGVEETASDYVMFAETAQLRLITGDVWVKPVWTRDIATGYLVSHPDRSHIATLRELAYYINIRAGIDGTSAIDIEQAQYDLGAFRTWLSIIECMRQAEEAEAAAEGRDNPEWNSLAAGAMPDALAINQLRNFLDAEPGSATSIITLSNWARASHEYITSKKSGNATSNGTSLRWSRPSASASYPYPMSGHEWGITQTDGMYIHYNWFSVWMFPAWTSAELQRINTLTLRMSANGTKDSGFASQKNVYIYGVKVSALPSGAMTVGSVIDRGTKVGSNTDARCGTTFDVRLSAAFVQAVKNGERFGVAVDCEQSRKAWGTVRLVING